MKCCLTYSNSKHIYELESYWWICVNCKSFISKISQSLNITKQEELMVNQKMKSYRCIPYLLMYTAYPVSVCDREIKNIYFIYNLLFYGRKSRNLKKKMYSCIYFSLLNFNYHHSHIFCLLLKYCKMVSTMCTFRSLKTIL